MGQLPHACPLPSHLPAWPPCTCHAVLGASVATITICPVQGCLSVAAPTPLLSAPRAQVRILGVGWGRECREKAVSDLPNSGSMHK